MKRRALSLRDDVAEMIDRIARSRGHTAPVDGAPSTEDELVLPSGTHRIRPRRPDADPPPDSGGRVTSARRA